MNEETVVEVAGVEDTAETHQGELEVKELEPWETIRNPSVRREQVFLRSQDTSTGSVVQMSRGRYEVTRQGWRKIKD